MYILNLEKTNAKDDDMDISKSGRNDLIFDNSQGSNINIHRINNMDVFL